MQWFELRDGCSFSLIMLELFKLSFHNGSFLFIYNPNEVFLVIFLFET